MTRWLEIAWAEVGTREVAGAAANADIIGYFHDAGRADITSDEVAWCAAFVGACLTRAGQKLPISQHQRLRARAYLAVGTEIDTLRPGAIAVFSRGGDPSFGHVGFVVGATPDHIVLLGGNQANAVSVMNYPRGQLLGLRWPDTPKTAAEVAAAGSRTAAAAGQQKRDTVKSLGLEGIAKTLPAPPAELPGLRDMVEQAGAWKGVVEQAGDLALFAWGKAPAMIGVVAVYFALRIAWRALAIGQWRAEDHNTGANTARAEVGEAA